MIVFFGRPGVGKTTQGKKLASSQGWRWISAGQLLRDSKKYKINDILSSGGLVDSKIVTELVKDAILDSKCPNNVIIDGYVRNIDQADWLMEEAPVLGVVIEAVIVIEVSSQILLDRLLARGREDDTTDVIKSRLAIYDKETLPVLEKFKRKNIRIIYIDGDGDEEQVYRNIIEELKKCKVL